MMPQSAPPAQGRLPDNIVAFARLLRETGMQIGPDRIHQAVTAVATAGCLDRETFRHALRMTLIGHRDQTDLFDQAFALFWNDPRLIEQRMAMMLHKIAAPRAPKRKPPLRRLADALDLPDRPDDQPSAPIFDVDATLTASLQEKLQQKDFEQMSAVEIAHARRLIAALKPHRPTRKRHCYQPDPCSKNRLDMRRVARTAWRHGDDAIPVLAYRKPRREPRPIVALCDISGSMSRYSRMMLHFLHALGKTGGVVFSFTFATRLTPISRAMRHSDIDAAMAQIGATTPDWDGGTRIATALACFNRHWARRVLGHDAVTLLITDGLERDDCHLLEREALRLRRRCRHILWLNPLLRYEGFEPQAAGMRALLPHIDSLQPIHNLDSMKSLAIALANLADPTAMPPNRRTISFPRQPQP